MVPIISSPYQFLQKKVDNVSMYRLVSGSLGTLAGISILFGFIGWLPYSGLTQIFSLALALMAALLVNISLSWILRIPANHESAVITALILFFLALPESDVFSNWPIVAAVTIGIASKYIVAYKKQHFINPAAFGAAALSVTGLYTFSWWAANPVLFVPLVVVGVLVVMKVRKWVPVLAFVGVSLIIYTAESISYGDALTSSLKTFFLSWPTLFLAFFMLTEPFTMPSRKDSQFLYGGVVGFLSNTTMFASFISITPELALVIANLAMMPWRLRQKLHMPLIARNTIANNTYEFVFKKPKGLNFLAGQYLEWMLPHTERDQKGVRRYFTIASSPTEADVRVSMKIMDAPSSFKKTLLQLDQNAVMIASQLAGDFVLPKDTSKKLGFIAGGIGVTPFRSHLKYMIDSNNNFDTVLYYANNAIADIAYTEFFKNVATTLRLEIIHVISKESVSAPFESGYLNAEIIKRRTPDYKERTWYISGPPGMVAASVRELQILGIPQRHIKKDFFPGA